jgi:sn-glycerol 3-phosphate transport system substrate-binding protein
VSHPRSRLRDRRVTAGLAAAVAGTTLALTACGGPSVGAGTTAEATTEATDWSQVEPASEITWWSNHPGQSQAVEEQLIAAFEAENPAFSQDSCTKEKLITSW